MKHLPAWSKETRKYQNIAEGPGKCRTNRVDMLCLGRSSIDLGQKKLLARRTILSLPGLRSEQKMKMC